MNRQSLLISALALTVTGAAVFGYGKDRVAAPKPAPSPFSTAPAASLELQQLAKQVRALELASVAQAATRAAEVAKPTEPAPVEVAPVEPKAPHLSRAEVARGLKTFFESAYAQESRDAGPAREFESALSSYFQQDPSVKVDGVDCRMTVCRLELVAAAGVEREHAIERLGFGPTKYGAYEYPGGDAGRSIVYVGMPGHPLQMPDRDALLLASASGQP